MGEPTGMLVDNAQALPEKVIPELTDSAQLQHWKCAARKVNIGWTQIQNPGTTRSRGCDRLYHEDRLKLRVYLAVG